MNAYFSDLVAALGRELGSAVCWCGDAAAEFQVDGVAFQVLHDESRSSGTLMLVAHLGPLSPGRECAAMKRLLQLNRLTFGSGAPVLALDPDSGAVVLLAEGCLRRTTASDVLQSARNSVGQAHRWCDEGLLQGPGATHVLAPPPADFA